MNHGTESLEGATFFGHKGCSSSGFRGDIGKGVAVGSHSTYNKGSINSESQFSSVGDNHSSKQPATNNFRPQKKTPIVYEYCSYNGHTKKIATN